MAWLPTADIWKDSDYSYLENSEKTTCGRDLGGLTRGVGALEQPLAVSNY